MKKLKWKEVEGYLLTKSTIYNGYTYILFWGTTSEMEYIDIYEGEKSYEEIQLKNLRTVDSYRSADRNYGKDNCINYAENHAKDHSGMWAKIKRILTKEPKK